MTQTIRGTIADFAGKLSLNGVILGQPELSMLTRIGRGSFFNAVGTVPKPAGQRGKPATIWELTLSADLNFKQVEAATVANTAAEDASEAASESDGSVAESLASTITVTENDKAGVPDAPEGGWSEGMRAAMQESAASGFDADL
jgi:hypothetical protein